MNSPYNAHSDEDDAIDILFAASAFITIVYFYSGLSIRAFMFELAMCLAVIHQNLGGIMFDQKDRQAFYDEQLESKKQRKTLIRTLIAIAAFCIGSGLLIWGMA